MDKICSHSNKKTIFNTVIYQWICYKCAKDICEENLKDSDELKEILTEKCKKIQEHEVLGETYDKFGNYIENIDTLSEN
jgi:S-adenosylmethionine/arginine decarboxylase-like enzyme